MTFHFKTIVACIFFVFSGFAHADAFVCIDQTGKKIFLNESCDKKGMKFGSHDFQVLSGQAINAVVITAPSALNDNKNNPSNHNKNKKGPWDFRAGPLKINPMILAFLLFSLLGVAAILSHQIYFYFKSYQQKLIWFKADLKEK